MLPILESGDFELGWANIRKSDHVGYSHGYSKRQTSVGTTNGAGGRNTQIFVLTPDLVVLHALPGFWHPEDLARELQFAKVVEKLWNDTSKSKALKERMFRRLHRREVYSMTAETYARSDWQGFDRFVEYDRIRRGEARDTVFHDGAGEPVMAGDVYKLKPLNVIAHERMARQPFRTLKAFDVEAFVDYGRMHYDNNSFEKKRKQFAGQEKLQRKRASAAKKRSRS